MGLTTEQTTEVIRSVAEVVDAATPDTTEVVIPPQPDPNYWWLLAIAIAPVIVIPLFLWVRKALSRKKP